MARMFRTGDLVRVRYFNPATRDMRTSEDAYEVDGWRESDAVPGERVIHLTDCAPFHHMQFSRDLWLDTAAEDRN